MARDLEVSLRENLKESNFNFIPNGVYTQREIYAHVEKKYPTLCDNDYLCIQNCKSGHNNPEWQHVVRSVMQTLKIAGRIINISRGSWELK